MLVVIVNFLSLKYAFAQKSFLLPPKISGQFEIVLIEPATVACRGDDEPEQSNYRIHYAPQEGCRVVVKLIKSDQDKFPSATEQAGEFRFYENSKFCEKKVGTKMHLAIKYAKDECRAFFRERGYAAKPLCATKPKVLIKEKMTPMSVRCIDIENRWTRDE